MDYSVTLIESDTGFTATCPELPGCQSRGATREEALENIRQAIQRRIEEADLEDPGHVKHDFIGF